MSSRRSRSGGKRDEEDAEPVVEILAEAARLDRRLEVPVRRRDDADVDPPGVRRSDALEFAFFEDAQERRLHIERQIADFVEEERPLSASSKRPCRVATAPVNAPRSWPNSSLSIKLAGSAAQLTRTSGRSRRGPRSCMARANSSLPVPVSPSRSTVLSVSATASTRASAARSSGLSPTISSTWLAAERPAACRHRLPACARTVRSAWRWCDEGPAEDRTSLTLMTRLPFREDRS